MRVRGVDEVPTPRLDPITLDWCATAAKLVWKEALERSEKVARGTDRNTMKAIAMNVGALAELYGREAERQRALEAQRIVVHDQRIIVP